VGGLAAAALPPLLPHVTGFDAPTRAHAARFAVELVPFVGVSAVNAAVRAAVEVHGRYARAALSPVIRAAALLGLTAALRGQGPDVLPLAMCVGAAAEGAWLLLTLRGAGVVPVPGFGLPPALRTAALGLVPVLAGESMVALNVWVDRLFAGALPEGSVSLLEYADRVRVIPQTFLEGSLLVVAFNTWARVRAEGGGVERHRAVAQSLWWVAVLAPPVLGGMFVGREALVRLLFEGGQFPPSATVATGAALGAFLPGVLCSLLGALVVKAHIVEGRYGLVLRLGVFSFALNLLLDALLYRGFGLVGLAGATSATNLCAAGAALLVLLPELRGTLPARAWWGAGAVTLIAGLLALPSIGEPPASVQEARLWIWAVPYLLLLAAGAAWTRRGP